jgi:MoaA/NifB/PqqE/SkfB family radical SAM enzyme
MDLDRLFLVITNQCNGRCRICNYWQHPAPTHLSLDFIQRHVIPIVKRHRIRLVIITGGEPTLHPELPQIARDLKQTGATITIITNGSNLDTLYPRLEDSVDAFLLSLDAPTSHLHTQMRGLSNFSQLIQYPTMIKKRNPFKQVAFSCVLQKRNVRHLEDYYKLAAALPIDGIFFNVPELKPHCFGRPGTVNDIALQETHLSEEELAIMERQLLRISKIDRSVGLLQQREAYFKECAGYFNFLNGNEPLRPPPPCRIPSQSIVIDEKENCLPCFYLPFSFPISQSGEQPFLTPELAQIREKTFKDSEFRRRHCGFCLQFQG